MIQNKNIGHSLIPEVRDLYEAWVEFTVTDASGKAFFRSGYLKPDGTSNPTRTVSPTGWSTPRTGFVDNHKVWTIHSVAYDNTIQSGRSTLVRISSAFRPAPRGRSRSPRASTTGICARAISTMFWVRIIRLIPWWNSPRGHAR